MKKSVVHAVVTFWVTLAVAIGMLGSAHAQSQVPQSATAPGQTKAKKKTTKAAAVRKRVSVKFVPGSGETAKDRSTRLKRECKGQVNAGACEGYTR